MVNEFKKELSKLLGVDLFNPRFRSVFKKYFPNENADKLNKEIEENSQKEDFQLDENQQNLHVNENDIDKTDDDMDIDIQSSQDEEDSFISESDEENEIPDDSDLDYPQPQTVNDRHLLEVSLELELIKAGIRRDRISVAKKLFLQDIHNLEDIAKVPSLVEQFPEWKELEKPQIKSFGMSLDEYGDGLTAEERRLREMGIDPKI